MTSEFLISLIVALLVVAVSIGTYYGVSGIMPGSKLVVSEPPVTPSGTGPNEATFMLFYTTWCPWSKKAQQPWASFKESLKNNPKKYGGKTIVFEEINADDDVGKTALYQVKAYPTFKLQTDKKVYEMLGKPSVPAFRAFLINALGNESS
jgi:thiol-disulfide isomerase/thioredoxin